MSKRGSLRRSRWLSPLKVAWLIAASLVLQPLGWSAANAANQVERLPSLASAAPATQVRVSDAYGSLPLSFEANQGQTDSRVQFPSRGRGYTLFLTPTDAVLALRQGTQKSLAPGSGERGRGRGPK